MLDPELAPLIGNGFNRDDAAMVVRALSLMTAMTNETGLVLGYDEPVRLQGAYRSFEVRWDSARRAYWVHGEAPRIYGDE